MTYEEAIININELNAVCEQKDFYDEDFNKALKVAVKCIEKQMELQDFIKWLDPVEEYPLIVILRKFLVDTDVSQNG